MQYLSLNSGQTVILNNYRLLLITGSYLTISPRRELGDITKCDWEISPID